MRACVRECVRACVCVHARVCVRVCVCECVRLRYTLISNTFFLLRVEGLRVVVDTPRVLSHLPSEFRDHSLVSTALLLFTYAALLCRARNVLVQATQLFLDHGLYTLT